MALARTTVTKIDVSMLSLKWGDVLSSLWPGAVVVFALAPRFAVPRDWLPRVDQLRPSVALLMVSVLAGELLGAVTRIVWEKRYLRRWHPNVNVLPRLIEGAHHLELYERGVQSSYKYVTFYANFAGALFVVIVARAAT